MPTFSPGAGTYTVPQFVTLSTTTPISTIHYTTDGSTPTTSSAVYHVPLYVYSSQTVKAIAEASGLSNSAVGSSAYVLGQQPLRVSLMRNSSSQVLSPVPLDDRMQPSSGVRWSDLFPTSGSTGVWTTYDAWVASSNAHGAKVTFTKQARPTWMTGLSSTTDGPSSDWNTATSCPTVGGVVFGTTVDCKWKTTLVRYYMHVSGQSTVPANPVSCPNLDTTEASNESNTYSGSSSSVGFSGSP